MFSLPILAALAFMAVVTSFISGIFGMAGGMLLIGFLLVVLPVPIAMVFHGVIQIAANGWRSWLWRHHISVPRSRIQHTDVTQGPYERRFGLATLVIYTAGTEHAAIPIEGLSHDTALAFRDALLVRGDAVVPADGGGDVI